MAKKQSEIKSLEKQLNDLYARYALGERHLAADIQKLKQKLEFYNYGITPKP